MTLTMIGYALRKTGKYDEGIACYAKALALDPNNVNTHEYLGEAYAEKGMLDLANAELAKVRETAARLVSSVQRRRSLMQTRAILDQLKRRSSGISALADGPDIATVNDTGRGGLEHEPAVDAVTQQTSQRIVGLTSGICAKNGGHTTPDQRTLRPPRPMPGERFSPLVRRMAARNSSPACRDWERRGLSPLRVGPRRHRALDYRELGLPAGAITISIGVAVHVALSPELRRAA